MTRLQRSLMTGSLTALVAACVLYSGKPGHSQKPKKKKTVTVDLAKPFQHGNHLKILRKDGDRLMKCGDCHEHKVSEQNKGFPICKKTRMPFPSHDKCTGCHPKAFWTRPLQICTNCHIQNTFTKQPPLKSQSSIDAPLRTRFDHRLHISPKGRVRKRFKYDKDCSSCHPFVAGGKRVVLPGHAQCCECHTKTNVEPIINDCGGCHSRPKWQKPPKSKIKQFSHVDHTLDPATGASLDCERCHSTVTQAKKVRDIKMPMMEACVECHQGEVAFDYTNCLKCHGKGIKEKVIPDSHKAAVLNK
jgi:c(7)-type cytochrome triheme protein